MKGYVRFMKRLAILVSTSLVIGIPLLHGCEKLNRIKTEQVSTTTESNQSNWEEEVNTTESESNSNCVEESNKLQKLNQEILENDIEWEIRKLDIEVDHEVSKQMMIDCLVNYGGYDEETVNKVIDNIKGVDWKYNCKVTFRSLLNDGSNPDRIPLMLKELQFTEEEIQYAIDNH